MTRSWASFLLFVAFWGAPHRAAADSQFQTRPYLMDVTTHSVAVLFVVAEPIDVSVVAMSFGHETREVRGARARTHELVLERLDPDTSYQYEVHAGSATLARGSFATAPESVNAPVRFLLYGDTRTNPAAHASIVRAMSRETADFVLHTGDFIPDGRRANDWLTYFDVAAPLIASTPLVPTVGNHDMMAGEGLANYRTRMRTPSGGSPNETYYMFQYGPVRILSIDTDESLRPGSPQRRWLENALEEAEASTKHIFMLMHHGPYSSGAHGSNLAISETDVNRLIRRHHVELVMSGHDHMYERGDAEGLKYIVSGGGGAPLYFTNTTLSSQLAFAPEHHYVRVEVTPDEVRITALGPDGHTLDACHFRDLRDTWHCNGGGPRGRVARPPSSSMARYIVALGAVLVLVVVLLARRRRGVTKKGS